MHPVHIPDAVSVAHHDSDGVACVAPGRVLRAEDLDHGLVRVTADACPDSDTGATTVTLHARDLARHVSLARDTAGRTVALTWPRQTEMA